MSADALLQMSKDTVFIPGIVEARERLVLSLFTKKWVVYDATEESDLHARFQEHSSRKARSSSQSADAPEHRSCIGTSTPPGATDDACLQDLKRYDQVSEERDKLAEDVRAEAGETEFVVSSNLRYQTDPRTPSTNGSAGSSSSATPEYLGATAVRPRRLPSSLA